MEYQVEENEQGSASLAGVVGLSLIAMGLALASLTNNQAQVGHSRQSRELAIARYVALAGTNDALSEVRTDTDGAGDRAGGLGALGLNNPIPFNDANGNQVGEYVTYVVNKAAVPATDPPEYYIRSLAAVPTFAAVTANQQGAAGFSMEVRLNSQAEFSLTPNLGAISFSGPIDSWELQNWGNSGFSIDGGDYPAVVFTDESAYDGFVNQIDDNWTAGWNLDGKISGAPNNTHLEGQAKEFEAPVSLQAEATFDADTLNDYRNALRDFAEDKAHVSASGNSTSTDWGSLNAAGELSDGTILVHALAAVKDGAGSGKPKIVTDLSFGGPGNEKTVVIDSSLFNGGGRALSDNSSRTISGEGTLVILHPIGSKSDDTTGIIPNLNWKGNVIVLGYPGDTTQNVGQNLRTDNLLYLSKADWNVEGNLILLSSGTTEASLEMRGTSGDTANLNVDGSLMIFAEATGREAEIDIESYANMTVNGIVGVYGKRAELENQNGGSGTNWTINGTLAVGLPDNGNSTSTRLMVKGSANFNFDFDNVTEATDSLAELQQNLVFQNQIPQGFTYSAQSWLLENRTLFGTFTADLAVRVGAGQDLFVDTALIQANQQ